MNTNFFKNRHSHFFLILAGFCLLFGCVPTKKITYLQYGDEKKREDPKDTIVRTYDLKTEPYLLKSEDVIAIRVASVTDDSYNFIKKYEEQLGIIRKLNQYDDGMGKSGNGTGGQINFGGNRAQNDQGLNTLALDRQNTGFVLDLNGEIELPEIGTLKLAGLTISEAEAEIKKSLEGYYETPMVRVQLLNYHFTIMGEVEKEGRYTSFDPEISVFDAILLAGNLTEFADRANIKIIRKNDGQAKVVYLNTLDETTLNAENFYLQRDDLIIVPALDARTANKYTLPNISKTLGLVGAIVSLVALAISLSR